MPAIQPINFLEKTWISSEKSLVEYCTILQAEYHLVGEMMEEGICFSPYSPKLTTGSMIFKPGDCAGQGR